MSGAIPITIIRHHKERKSKCSLQPLKDCEGITFIEFKPGITLDATGIILVTLEGQPLSEDDAIHPLLLLDSTWRLLPQLEGCLTGNPIKRSLPENLQTAYPRISKTSQDPHRGLASIEALYAAKKLLGQDDPALLDSYFWKQEFLQKNF